MTNLKKSLAAGVAIACIGGGVAHAELIYAATQVDNNLISFDSANPGVLLASRGITGFQAGETVRSLDYANGQLYALGSSSRLYTIDPTTGAATVVGGQFGTLLNGTTFGMAYDMGAGQFRIVSDLDQSLMVTPLGVASVGSSLQYAVGDANASLNPVVNAVAYAGGTLWALDSSANILASLNPATGNLTTLGPLGVDISRYNGFSVSPGSGTAYVGSPATSGGLSADLWTLNPGTGQLTLVGHIGDAGDNYLLNGLAVVPEPSSAVLMGLAGLTMFAYVWRRRR